MRAGDGLSHRGRHWRSASKSCLAKNTSLSSRPRPRVAKGLGRRARRREEAKGQKRRPKKKAPPCCGCHDWPAEVAGRGGRCRRSPMAPPPPEPARYNYRRKTISLPGGYGRPEPRAVGPLQACLYRFIDEAANV